MMAAPSPGPSGGVMTVNGGDFQSQYTAQIGQAGSVASTNTGKLADNSTIFMGRSKDKSNLFRTGPQTGPYAPPSTSTEINTDYANAILAPTRWSSDQLAQFVNNGIMRKVAGFDVGMGMPEILSAWDDLVKTSFLINKGKANDDASKWTPWDVMNSYSNSANKFGTVRRGDWEYDVATGEKVKYVGPKTKTQTSKQVDLSSAADVQAITTQVLTQALGRAPTAKELATYKATINGAEQANPTVSTQTQTLNDMGEVVNTSTKTSGGMSAEAKAGLVQQGAKQGPEYGKYQSATTYYNAMMAMITGGG
jgi:hypothetical protein